MRDGEVEIDEGNSREEIRRDVEAETDEVRRGRRWWGEVKSRRSEIDMTRVYIGVGDNNDVIYLVAHCQFEQVRRSEIRWGSAWLGWGMLPHNAQVQS